MSLAAPRVIMRKSHRDAGKISAPPPTPDLAVAIRSRWAAARALTILASCLAAAALSCGGPSEDTIKTEFDAYVAGANACAAVADCQIVFPGCPLGCEVAVRADRSVDVMKKAASLIQQYESGSHSGCAYSCAQLQAACTQGQCAVETGAP
jgi:hypothetical protein